MPTVFVSFLLGFTQPQLRSAEVCLARALKHLGRQDSLPKCSDATAIHAVQNTITDKIPRALKCLCKSAAGQCSSLRLPLRPQDGKAVCEKSTAPYKCGMARDGPQDILPTTCHSSLRSWIVSKSHFAAYTVCLTRSCCDILQDTMDGIGVGN